MKSLFLIDTHNVLYRTFYGIPRLAAPDGTPTNAVFGTARILLKILREEKPAAIAAVFDSPGPTPRHALFPEYKANRLKVPEDLASQIPLVKELIDALGIPRLEVPGVEADDVIGTLARLAEEEGMDVVIVSSDKDLYQLVSERVRIRDGLKERAVGEREVRETFGVEPSQVVDLLALAGDPSDNVPGVPGIGEKTAAGLIREFGTLDALLERLESVTGAKRERIERHADLARLSRTLARIDRNVPLEAGPEGLRTRGVDAGRAAALFRRLDFRKLAGEVEGEAPLLPIVSPPVSSARAGRFRRAADADELIAALGPGPPERAALAIERGAGSAAALAAPGRGAWVFPGDALPEAARRLARAGTTLYVHEGKPFLRRLGEGNEAGDTFFDVQVAGYLLAPDEGTPAFEKLVGRFLPGVDAPAADDAEGLQAARAEALLALGGVLESRLAAEGLVPIFREVDMPLLPVLVGMEDRGIGIDTAVFRALSTELAAATAAIEARAAEIAGAEVNINSPKQLAFLLFEKLRLPPVKRTKTGFSTDVEVLERLKGLHPVPALVLEYRTLAKIRSTYVDVLPGMADPGDGRVRTTFHLTQTATGRLSSSDPNLQNIPVRTELGKRIRSGFVAAPGSLFIGADYSQVELRLLAHLSGEGRLLAAFRGGEDVHASTASDVFGVPRDDVTPELRRRAKVINFGIVYGMSAFGLARELGIGGREAQAYIDGYFQRYPAVREYLERIREGARRDGYVRTILGRRRDLRDINSRNRTLREAAERMAINAPIQGSAADVIKLAMIRADREFRARRMGAGLVLQIHDELIVEAPEAEAEAAGAVLREAMEGAVSLSVPLTLSLSVGRTWGEIH